MLTGEVWASKLYNYLEELNLSYLSKKKNYLEELKIYSSFSLHLRVLFQKGEYLGNM